MTHCAGYRAAAAARTDRIIGLGIDGEPHAPLPEGVLDVVAIPQDREHLVKLSRTHSGVCWDRLMYSAKETTYKIWYPLTGTWLGFEDVQLIIDPIDSTFTALLLVSAPSLNGRPVTTITGRWLIERCLVVTAATLPAVGGQSRSA